MELFNGLHPTNLKGIQVSRILWAKEGYYNSVLQFLFIEEGNDCPFCSSHEISLLGTLISKILTHYKNLKGAMSGRSSERFPYQDFILKSMNYVLFYLIMTKRGQNSLCL